MSAKELQRVAVRMLYDERLVEQVYEDVDTATAGCDLTSDERNWLRTPDRRAWRVDPLRRARSLAALVEEFAVSVALFVRTTPAATTRLDEFFASDAFHRGIQAGESLAQVFAAWFRDLTIHRDFVDLEASLARARRTREARRPVTLEPGHRCLAPAVEVLVLAGQTAASFGAILGTLRRGPVAECALDRNVDLPLPSPGEPEGVLVDGRGQEPRLELLSPELAEVLALLARPRADREFVAEAARHGAGEADCRAILASFTEDGIVLQA